MIKIDTGMKGGRVKQLKSLLSITFRISFCTNRLFMHFIAFQIQMIRLELKNLGFNNFKVPFNVKTSKAGFAKRYHFQLIIPMSWVALEMKEKCLNSSTKGLSLCCRLLN